MFLETSCQRQGSLVTNVLKYPEMEVSSHPIFEKFKMALKDVYQKEKGVIECVGECVKVSSLAEFVYNCAPRQQP